MTVETSVDKTGVNRRRASLLYGILLLLLLVSAGWVRFESLSAIGLGRSYDNGSYLKHAKNFGEETVIKRFAPIVFAMDHLAIKLFGYNDYSIKVLRAITDLCVLILLIAMVSFLTGDRWVGIAAGLLYAFATKIVRYSRTEMAHVPATLILFMAFCALVLYMRQKERDMQPSASSSLFLWLGISGFLAGISMTAHPSLCFSGPVFVMCIAIRYLLERNAIKRRVFHAIRDMAIFTICFFIAFWGISFFLYSPDELYSYFRASAGISGTSRGVWGYEYNMRAILNGYPDPFSEGMRFLIDGLRWIAGSEYTEILVMERGGLYPMLFFGTVPIMLVLSIRQRGASPSWAYATVFCVVSFALFLGFFLRLYTLGTSRYMIPFFPIAILGICFWYHAFFSSFMRSSRAGVVVLLISVAVLLYERPVCPGDPELREPFTIAKELHVVLGERVDDQNRLLALPYGIGAFLFGRKVRSSIWLSHPLYFGKNCVWPREVDVSEAGTGDVVISPNFVAYDGVVELFRACVDDNIRFVFVAMPTHINANAYFNGKPPFDEEEERRFIQIFLKGVGAQKIYFSESGVLYELPDLDSDILSQIKVLDESSRLDFPKEAISELPSGERKP